MVKGTGIASTDTIKSIPEQPLEEKRRSKFMNTILGFLARFLGWWVGLAGLMAVSGTFHGACGSRPECLGCLVIRIGSITIVSGAGALLMSKWRKLWQAIKRGFHHKFPDSKSE